MKLIRGPTMTKTTVKSRVGSDGILQLSVPLGVSEKNRDVMVTIEEASAKPLDQRTWHDFLASIEGKWQGEFERPPQGKFELREEFP
jgi:hypothetical protein